jgi:gamma-glutamyltranspeptidase/glutathione hydrolase
MQAEEVRAFAQKAQFGRKQGTRGSRGMVISAHPLATRAGVDLLRAGGNACDAALATSITQTVVEPHMTTITGVLSMLYHDAATGKTSYVNGSMNTPLAPLTGFGVADLSTGRGVGVPGWWAGFEAALSRHGTKTKREVMADAIQIARDGFEVHPFLFGEMFVAMATLGRTPEARSMFMPEGTPLRPGQTLRQLPAARTLERLRDEGNEYFYRGDFAARFVDTVKDAGGVITREDFERYEVRWQEPARGTYRGYSIAASPPPDNGGTHIIEALNMFELLDLQRMGPPTESPESLFYMARTARTVWGEGARHTDPASHHVPMDVIVSKEYARIRMEFLEMGKKQAERTAEPVPAYPGSNHVTVVDGSGNVATILHSCMALPWYNGLFCEGVSICAGGGHFLRIMPGPGERATCYVAPNIVFRDGRPILASGSPSVGLVENILQNTVNLLDFGVPIDESVHRPRFGGQYRDGPGPMIEADVDEAVRKGAEKLGISWDLVNPWNWHLGSFEGIWIDPETGEAAACADPRRAGLAMAA